MKNHLPSAQLASNKSFVLSLFIVLSSFTGFSQISTNFITFPDTSYLGKADSTVTVRIINLDNTTYSGYIHVYYTTDTVAFSPILLCSVPSVTLFAFDTLLINTSCAITFDSNYFDPGSNIVVIWSSGNARFAADSLWDSVLIEPLQAVGIYETNLNTSFIIAPSPAQDHIRIKLNRSAQPKDMLQQIKITDIYGRTMHAEPFVGGENQKINIQHLPVGLYFLELLYENKQRAVRKFIRSD